MFSEKLEHKLDNIERILLEMTQGLTDLTNAVNAAIEEIATLVTAIQAATAGTPDAQLEALVAQLNTAVTAAKTAISPPVTTPVA